MKLNGFHLKTIALALMFADHFARYLGVILPSNVPLFLMYVGRIAAPIFFYLAVESYFKTSNRRRYITRLYTWALIMQVGNYIVSLIVKAAYQPEYIIPIEQNIFLSIAIGVSMIAAAEWGHGQAGIRKWGGFTLALLLAYFSLLTEGSRIGFALFIVFYFFYNKKPALYYAYAGLCVLSLLKGLDDIKYFWQIEFQWMMIAALPLIMLYNGERGCYNMKYLFYTFYPLHIWALYFTFFALGLNKP